MFEILCEPSDLTAMRAALVEAGIEVAEASVQQRPKTLVPLDEDGATKLMKLIDTLEDLDDTDEVHANFDIDAESPGARRGLDPAVRPRIFSGVDRHDPAPLDRDRGQPVRPRDLPAAVLALLGPRWSRLASISASLNHARASESGASAKLCGWWISPGE